MSLSADITAVKAGSNTSVEVIFYDGIVSRPQQAVLSLPDGSQHTTLVLINTATQQFCYKYEDMQLIGALGQINPVIELPDEARIEFLQPQLPAWLNLHTKAMHQRIWSFERSPLLIACSLVVMVVIMGALVKFGIPYGAQQLALHLPADTLDSIGSQAQENIEQLTEKSQLPIARQQQIRQLYTRYVAGQHPAKLIFRQGDNLGANALALPNNTIVMTDELVQLAQDDRELIGVLAHEQGHLTERHTMQQVLSALGMTVVITWITGDVSDLVSNAPYALLSLSYSRKFERQADLYAMQTLSRQHIPVSYFANFLSRMEKDDADIELLSTHPATTARIAAVEAFARQQHIVPASHALVKSDK